MTISTIIPLYNGKDYIEGTLNNLWSQTLPPNEIIVIDDGSTDGSVDIIKKYPQIIYRYQENKGPSAARNHGVTIASGELISFLDHDDIYPENKLEIQHHQFLMDVELSAVIGAFQYHFNSEKAKLGYTEMHEGNITNHCLLGAGLFKKELFSSIGLFDENVLLADDFDWYQRLFNSNKKIKKINVCCLLYRKHETNSSNNKIIAQKGLLLALKKTIAMKRAQENA